MLGTICSTSLSFGEAGSGSLAFYMQKTDKNHTTFVRLGPNRRKFDVRHQSVKTIFVKQTCEFFVLQICRNCRIYCLSITTCKSLVYAKIPGLHLLQTHTNTLSFIIRKVQIPPLKLTASLHLKMKPWKKERFLLETIMFRVRKR